MIINNVFNIKTYAGSSELPLFNPPNALVTDATYTTFMSNISTIYGTQENNGIIPIFYKTNNIADDRSTLRFLKPSQSYYFISKSDAVFPYNIPYSGTLITSTYKNCPSLDFNPNKVVLTSGSGNYYYISHDVSNLNIAYPYTYEVKVLHSNWKLTTIPVSGTVKSSQNANNIACVVRFDNDYDVTDYSTFLPAGTSVSQIDKRNLFGIIEVSLTSPEAIDCPQVLDLLTIQCDNCIPSPSPTPTRTPTPTPTPAAMFSNQLVVPGSPTFITGNSLTLTGSTGDKLQYTAQSLIDANPATMNISIAGTIVASVVFPFLTYATKPFKFTKASTGISYTGTFTAGIVTFS